MKLSLLFIAAAALLIFSVDGRVFITIDSFATLQSPLILIVPANAPDDDWYSIYPYDPYFAGDPQFAFHNTDDAIGGQRDVMLGYEGSTPQGSVSIISLVDQKLSIAFPLGYHGGAYVQWDGDDSAGGASAFPGASLNFSPGIGSGGISLPESNGVQVDFTSFGRAIGIGITVSSDLQVSYFLDALDSVGNFNELAFNHLPTNEDTEIRYFFLYTDPLWSFQGFDWTNVSAFQVKVFTFNDGSPNAVDTDFFNVHVVGYEVLGNVFLDCGCIGTPTSFIASEQFDLFLGSTQTTFLQSTFSDINGDFSFDGLTEGTYTICFNDFSLDRCAPTNGCRTFTLANEIDPPVQTFSVNLPSGLTAPPDITVECGSCLTVACLGSATANNCGGGSTPVTTFSDSPIIGTCTQTFTRTFSDQGLFASQVVTIVDTTNPVILSPASAESRACDDFVSISYNDWLSSDGFATFDDCNTFSVSNNAGASDPCGTVFVTFTATDVCGLQTSSVGSYTIVDNNAPTFVQDPVDDTADCDEAGGSDFVAFNNWLASNGGAVVNDNCSGVSMSNNFVQGSLDRGCSESVAVTYTATDNCGNQSSRVATFTIQDLTGPVISPGASSPTVECDSNSVSSFNAWLSSNGNAQATDDCGSSGVTFTNNFAGVAPFGCDSSVTVTFTASDACFATAQTTGTYTVIDTQAPVITVPASNFSSNCDSQSDDLNTWLNDDGGARAIDDCQGAVGFTNNFGSIVDVDCTSTLVTFTACDNCGQCVDTSASFSIVDDEAPFFISGPFDQSVECATDTQTAYDNWVSSVGGGASFGDNCASSNEISITDNAPINAPVISGSQCTASVDVTYRLTDPCGNVSPASVATFSVTDSQNPSITIFPADETVDCASTNNNDYNNWRNTRGGGEATDACSSVTWSNNGASSFTLSVGSCFDSETVTFTASDACGNFVSTTASFSIIDNTPPTITTPASDDFSECNTSAVDAWLNDNGGARATDACSAVTFTNNFFGFSGGCTETAFVTFTATDACGLASDTSAVFSVTDTTPPVINPQASNLSVPCDSNTQTELSDWLNDNGGARASDACQDDNDLFWTVDDGSVIGCDFETFTFVVTDACGNSRSTTATFTSVDNDIPTFSPPPSDTTVECDGAGNISDYDLFIATHGGANAIDECALSLTFSSNGPATGPTSCGSVSVAFSVEDECNNIATQTARFIVQDTQAPFFNNLPNSLSVECDGAGNTSDRSTWVNSNGGASASDVCAPTLSWTQTIIDSTGDACFGTDIYEFTAFDDCGNSVSATAGFTIHDFSSPAISVPASDITMECDGNGNVSGISAWINDSGGARGSDVCQGAILFTNDFSSGSGIFTCTSVTVTFTANDGCGNVAFTSAVLTIDDTVDPTFTFFPDDITVPCDADVSTDVLGFATAFDVCAGDLFVTFTEVSFDEPPVGDCPGDHIITRTFSAFDDCGNSISRDQVITVVIQRSSGPCDPVGCECDDCCPPAAPSDCIAVDCQPANCRTTPCEASTCSCDLAAKSASTIRQVDELPLCKPVYIYVNDDDDTPHDLGDDQVAPPPRMLVSNEALHL